LVDLLNLFQTGGKGMRGGHMALVCAKPHVGNEALRKGDCLPKEAGLMGIITLEDVLEALLQEQIYDEMDREELQRNRLARMVFRKWKTYTKRKKQGLLQPAAVRHDPAILAVVAQAVTGIGSPMEMEEGLVAGETTALLETPSRRTKTEKEIKYFT
jgi:hypothetical protein